MQDVATYIVNAFTTGEPFSGNPAGVCVLRGPAEEKWMQAIAANLNLAETAFLYPSEGSWRIRYFSPVTEIPLCGHATLASGAVLYETGTVPETEAIDFHAPADRLRVSRNGPLLSLRLPAYPLRSAPLVDAVEQVTGKRPLEVFQTARSSSVEWIFAIYPSAADIAGIRVDPAILRASPLSSLCLSAPGNNGDDYVLRFFAPEYGIDEDDATGSAHCGLGPYWAAKAGMNRLRASQLSRRGAAFTIETNQDSVVIGGSCTIVVKGVTCI